MPTFQPQAKFVDVNGTLKTQKRPQVAQGTIDESGVNDPKNLMTLLRKMQSNITDIQSRPQTDFVEFERDLPASGTITLAHGFNGPVRYSVVTWTRLSTSTSYPTSAPVLVMDALSDTNNLVLQSAVAGRAIIRIERATQGINV